MKGYWNRPEETAQVIDADGCLHTGDMAKMDEKGYFSIVDRKKDMIMVSGFNVYPNEVEDVIAMMTGVLEVAAVGVLDGKYGEAVELRSEERRVGKKGGIRCKSRGSQYN